MLAILSPAKSMNESRTTGLSLSRPRFEADADGLVKLMADTARDDVQAMMKISDALTDLNVGRYRDFHAQEERPAALLYDGDVYSGLDAASLDDEGMTRADGSLRILSGLYGLLRPLDAIRPHRLEMGTRLDTPRGKGLYSYWGARIADALREDLAERDDGTVLNLASVEYSKAVDRAALDRPVIDVAFVQTRDGEARNIAFHAKRARGMMARFLVDNAVDRASGAKDFAYGDYRFDAGASTDTRFVFSRPQPEPRNPGASRNVGAG